MPSPLTSLRAAHSPGVPSGRGIRSARKPAFFDRDRLQAALEKADGQLVAACRERSGRCPGRGCPFALAQAVASDGPGKRDGCLRIRAPVEDGEDGPGHLDGDPW